MTERLSFEVRGSSSEPYIVTFISAAGVVSATCTCQAGQQRQACKHRISLMVGDFGAVIGEIQDRDQALSALLAGTGLERALNQLLESERAADAAKAAATAARKALGRLMHATADTS